METLTDAYDKIQAIDEESDLEVSKTMKFFVDTPKSNSHSITCLLSGLSKSNRENGSGTYPNQISVCICISNKNNLFLVSV